MWVAADRHNRASNPCPTEWRIFFGQFEFRDLIADACTADAGIYVNTAFKHLYTASFDVYS
jgi:hypothetical protein